MSSAGVSTLTSDFEKSRDGVRTFNFGRPLSSTVANDASPFTTEDSDTRKSVQVGSVEAGPKSTTLSKQVGEYFRPIKNWEGVVESVAENTFVASMREVDNADDRGDEQFEIDHDDVDPGDRELVVPGGIFYFTVGYTIQRGGTRIKGTQIVFRRMPRWSKRDIQRANARADRLLEILTKDGPLERRVAE